MNWKNMEPDAVVAKRRYMTGPSSIEKWLGCILGTGSLGGSAATGTGSIIGVLSATSLFYLSRTLAARKSVMTDGCLFDMNAEKQCFKCLISKPLSEFYKHPAMADGYLGKCKECTKKDSTDRRNNKIEEVRAYDRQRGRLPHRLQAVRDYKKTPKGKEMIVRSLAGYREKYPEKTEARTILNNAVRDGKVIKLPCCICGSEESDGHHEDYSKPLDVVWLCRQHHADRHSGRLTLEEINGNEKIAS